jgi:hypothetical protein
VSEITERLWAEYQGFAGRELTEFDVLYLRCRIKQPPRRSSSPDGGCLGLALEILVRLRRGEPTARRRAAATSSHWTHRWREPDLNRWFPKKTRSLPRAAGRSAI